MPVSPNELDINYVDYGTDVLKTCVVIDEELKKLNEENKLNLIQCRKDRDYSYIKLKNIGRDNIIIDNAMEFTLRDIYYAAGWDHLEITRTLESNNHRRTINRDQYEPQVYDVTLKLRNRKI